MSTQIRVGGLMLSMVGPWGSLQWSHVADGGCKEASWTMVLPRTFTHPILHRNSIVQVMDGPSTVWRGFLTEPDYNSVGDDGAVTFTALGLSAAGADFLCFDSAGNTTSTPGVAVAQAILRGLPWIQRASLDNAPYAASDTTDGLNKVSTLLDGWATSVGKRWGVDAAAQVYAAADPTVPTWHMVPGSGRFGLADDEYASDLFMRYVNTGGTYSTATASDVTARAAFGRREEAVDITSLGPVALSKAQSVGQGLLVKGKARQGWTNGVSPSKWQLTTPGGSPAHLPFVRAQQMVRMHGVPNEQGQSLPYVDWVIGETAYEAGSSTIGLTPVGLVARDLTTAMTLMGAGS